jgi:RNA polymerase sigma-70 factor (ECF subfamily)
MDERSRTSWDWGGLAALCRAEARRVLHNPHEADDVAQDALARAWRQRSTCRTPENPSPWVRTIAHNEALRALGRRRDSQPLEEVPALADWSSADRLDESVSVRSALAELSAQDRALLHLRYEEDLTQPSIARMMDMPEGTVKVRLHRLRARLMPTLSDLI